MINSFTKKLFDDINDVVGRTANAGLSQSQLRQMVESALRRCQLVTREEFDAQQAVLLRTREKVEQLERQVSALEAKIGAGNTEDIKPDLDVDTRASWEL